MNKARPSSNSRPFNRKSPAESIKITHIKANEAGKGVRIRDPARTRCDILRAATTEFTRHGLSGARVDRIAQKTATTKRMIYYYFKNKAALYKAVLEEAYRGIRQHDAGIDYAALSPTEAIRKMIGATLSYETLHPEFVSMVSTENINRAKFMAGNAKLHEINAPVLQVLGDILERGWALKLFRNDVNAIDVHLMISALCFFRMANRFTVKAAFQYDMAANSERSRIEGFICDAVLGFLLRDNKIR